MTQARANEHAVSKAPPESPSKQKTRKGRSVELTPERTRQPSEYTNPGSPLQTPPRVRRRKGKRSRSRSRSSPPRRRRRNRRRSRNADRDPIPRRSHHPVRLNSVESRPRSPAQQASSSSRGPQQDQRVPECYEDTIIRCEVNRIYCCQSTLDFALKLGEKYNVEDHKMIHKLVAQPFEVRRLLMRKGLMGAHPGYWITLANKIHKEWKRCNRGDPKRKWKCNLCDTWTFNQWDCCFKCASLAVSDPQSNPHSKDAN